jgi:hypothetical protein
LHATDGQITDGQTSVGQSRVAQMTDATGHARVGTGQWPTADGGGQMGLCDTWQSTGWVIWQIGVWVT